MTLHRSSCSQMFFTIGVLKNFANFTGIDLCWSLFLIKLQANSVKTRPQHSCEISKYNFFYRATPVAASIFKTLDSSMNAILNTRTSASICFIKKDNILPQIDQYFAIFRGTYSTMFWIKANKFLPKAHSTRALC